MILGTLVYDVHLVGLKEGAGLNQVHRKCTLLKETDTIGQTEPGFSWTEAFPEVLELEGPRSDRG